MRGQVWVALLAAVMVGGCLGQKAAPERGQLLVLWSEARTPGSSEFELTLFNTGKGPLQVENLELEGGAVATFSHLGPHTLLPGEKCQLVMVLDGSREGAVLHVESDSLMEPSLRLPLVLQDAWATATSGE